MSITGEVGQLVLEEVAKEVAKDVFTDAGTGVLTEVLIEGGKGVLAVAAPIAIVAAPALLVGAAVGAVTWGLFAIFDD